MLTSHLSLMSSRSTTTILLAIGSIAAAGATAYAQGTFVFVGFDGPPVQAPGTGRFVDEYNEAGLRFRPIGEITHQNRLVRNGGGIEGRPDNGTAFLDLLAGSSLSFRFIDGRAFNLHALDIAEYSTVFPYPMVVEFYGYRADGSTVTRTLTTDGIIDGTGPLADFETFSFGKDFFNVVRVEVPTDGWSLDNLVVSVPEPGVGSLMLLGLGAFALMRRRIA